MYRESCRLFNTTLTFLCTPQFGHSLTRNGHRHITADKWASNNLDFFMTDVDGWERTVSTNNINPDYHTTIKHVYMAEISEIQENEFPDSIPPCQMKVV